MKSLLKRLVGPHWQARLHRLSRVRWITKYRLMRTGGGNPSFGRRLSYVFFDAETESFSYELADEGPLLGDLAEALGAPAAELLAYAREVAEDPELGEQLTRHLRGRFDVNHRMPLGHRLAWYALARHLKPATIVETGIYEGLGSLALLRALERNRHEDHPGELLSFDYNADAGSVVREGVAGDWRKLTGLTSELLEPALAGRTVALLLHDTDHTEANQRLEFGAALAHAAPTLVLVDGSGGASPVLRELCLEHGGSYHELLARSREHIYVGNVLAFGVFERRQ